MGSDLDCWRLNHSLNPRKANSGPRYSRGFRLSRMISWGSAQSLRCRTGVTRGRILRNGRRLRLGSRDVVKAPERCGQPELDLGSDSSHVNADPNPGNSLACTDRANDFHGGGNRPSRRPRRRWTRRAGRTEHALRCRLRLAGQPVPTPTPSTSASGESMPARESSRRSPGMAERASPVTEVPPQRPR